MNNQKYFPKFHRGKRNRSRLWTRFRTSLRLIETWRRIHLCRSQTVSFSRTAVNIAVHRFEEFIGGRSYVIEVKAVARDRWRAYILRLPGVPTALMPFYGPTPADAAHQLSNWLTKAHERVSKPGGSV